jgi:hypothetical protein
MTDLPPTGEPGPADPKPTREKLGRPPRFVVLVAAAVVLAFAGWSVVWYFGTQKAHAMIGAWLAAEAAKGRTYDCAERGVGGYPFRVIVTCLKPSLDIADASPRIRATGEDFRAIAQVWNLTHVIYEIDGPVRVETGSRKNPRSGLDLSWDLLQGSLRAPGGEIASGDLAISGFAATPDPKFLGPGGGMTVTASAAEFHGRRGAAVTGTPPGTRDVDVAADAKDLVVTLAGKGPPDAVDVSFVGRLGALPYPPPRDPAAFFAAWRDKGGSIEVAKLSAAQGETELRAVGTLTPDGAGRPEGSVTIKLAGPDINTPGAAGAFGGLAPIMALALRFAGKADEIDGRTAVSGQVDFRDGQLFLGPMPIVELPRMF